MTDTFSDIYFQPSALQDDSPRMRAQLAATYTNVVNFNERQEARDYIQQHCGVMARSSKSYDPLDIHFLQGNLRDVLDSITAIADWLDSQQYFGDKKTWLSEVQRIFDQQHVKYALDSHGTVRLRVDKDFEVQREATLSGLNLIRYAAVRVEFEAAYRALSATHGDGKQAVRSVFEACEVTFRLMFPNTRRVGAPEIGANLTPLVEQHYADDLPALEAAKKLVQGFAAWVASAQFYRHGQGQEEPNQPPLEVAVAVLSSGASYLRWLVHLDQAKLAAEV
ncbi:hypothetical protein ASF56_23850 [Methylobacterium sp. Leaf122]|nr:hypothetical protein [Methylobacterium sp. Leaf122]KQQ15522.1 hypothetical protein ASF56_23850 [Methylobacterium sp. Leaf122]